MYDLTDIYENAKDELEEAFPLYNKNASTKENIRDYKKIGNYFKCITVGGFVLLGDTKKLAQNLKRLANIGEGILSDFEKRDDKLPAYLNLSLISALSLGEFDQAIHIARISNTHKSEWEYKDEFYAAMFLRDYLLSINGDSVSEDDLQSYCTEIEENISEQTARVIFYRALLDGDEEASIAAFLAWNLEYANSVEMAWQNETGNPWDVLGNKIWLEGLAFMRLAEKKNIKLAGTYEHLPSVIQQLSYENNVEDIALGKTELISTGYL